MKTFRKYGLNHVCFIDFLNFGDEETLLAPINRYLALSFFGSVSTFWWDERVPAKIFISPRSRPHLNAIKKKKKTRREKKERNIITQAAAIACNIKLPLKSILYYIQFLNPTSQSALPPMAPRALEIFWPLTGDDECSRDRPCVTVGCKQPHGGCKEIQDDRAGPEHRRLPWLPQKNGLGPSAGPIESRAGSGNFLDDWQALAASRAGGSDRTSAASAHIWKWHISFGHRGAH